MKECDILGGQNIVTSHIFSGVRTPKAATPTIYAPGRRPE